MKSILSEMIEPLLRLCAFAGNYTPAKAQSFKDKEIAKFYLSIFYLSIMSSIESPSFLGGSGCGARAALPPPKSARRKSRLFWFEA